jgi:hypothetical protein
MTQASRSKSKIAQKCSNHEIKPEIKIAENYKREFSVSEENLSVKLFFCQLIIALIAFFFDNKMILPSGKDNSIPRVPLPRRVSIMDSSLINRRTTARRSLAVEIHRIRERLFRQSPAAQPHQRPHSRRQQRRAEPAWLKVIIVIEAALSQSSFTLPARMTAFAPPPPPVPAPSQSEKIDTILSMIDEILSLLQEFFHKLYVEFAF